MIKKDVSWHIALTGGMGSGKSSVSAWLAQQGARIFDADAVVHQILKTPEALGWAQELWGDACLEDGSAGSALNTRKIAKVVFSDIQARQAWEGFIHPQIDLCLEHWLATPDSGRLIIYDIPLFFETDWGQGRRIDEIWVVYAPRKQCVERLEQQRGMSLEDIEARLSAQIPLEKKAAQADVVIDNSGSWVSTLRQLEDILGKRMIMESD
ncbi:MAG: dephospho-CoA kinase [Peptococcaceae bacterium]|nr:dephospho-CoA kinase [Peptococcaceae bacterium]